MKKAILDPFLITVLVLAVACLAPSCNKKDSARPEDSTPKQWVKVYKDVMLGDQSNTTIGHFLKTQTGEVVSIENSFAQQGYMSLMYFTEYGSNRLYFTFPGNAYSESISKEDEPGNFFTRATVGLNFWDAAQLNTGEIKYAATMDEDMNMTEFNALAQSLAWKDFDAKFKAYNNGDANLSFSANSIMPQNGAIYMLQLNNSVRAFVYMKNVIAGSASGGSIRFDIVIEGTDDYANNTQSNKIQPGKN